MDITTLIIVIVVLVLLFGGAAFIGGAGGGRKVVSTEDLGFSSCRGSWPDAPKFMKENG